MGGTCIDALIRTFFVCKRVYVELPSLQVDEMEKAVDVAEKNMTRFGLTTQEIKSRRSWVHDTRRTVSDFLWLHGHGKSCW